MDDFFTACGAGGLCDTLGMALAAVLTLLVLSYLIHDTFLFRIASSLLVGTAVGFVSAVVIRTVLLDRLVVPLWNDAGNLFANQWFLFIPLLFGISILLRLAPRVSSTAFGYLGLAYLFGIGAALAIGSALAGFLVPQVIATMQQQVKPTGDNLNWLNGIIIVVGTIGAFLAFRFIQPGNRSWQRVYAVITNVWGTIGRGFIMIAFGAILAGIVLARVSALVGQLYFLIHDWLPIVK